MFGLLRLFGGRNRRRAPLGIAILIAGVKILFVVGLFHGAHGLEENHSIKNFAKELRGEPGVSSVAELKGSAKPASADVAYDIDGGEMILTFDKSFGKLEVGWMPGPSATAKTSVALDTTLHQVAIDKGFTGA